MQEVTAKMASGNTIRIDEQSIRVIDQAGVEVRVIDASTITRVTRATNMRIDAANRGGERFEFEMKTPDDAGIVERALRALTTTPETQAKAYDKEIHYIHDVSDMAAEGWQVVSTAVFQPRSGWARILISAGWLAVVYPPKPQIIATYTRKPA